MNPIVCLPPFKQQIESKAGRRASPIARGGDRKSEKYRASKENHYSDPFDFGCYAFNKIFSDSDWLIMAKIRLLISGYDFK